MVKLYKLDPSPPAQAAMIACDLFNVPTEFIDVDILGGENMTPEYLEKNPMHTVPVLEDGDLIIRDSNAILMYLADVYGKDDSFYPKDPKQRAEVNQMLFYNATILFQRLRNVMWSLLIEKNKEIQHFLDLIEEAYGYTEAFLSQTKYLAGNNITIADIAAYCNVVSHGLLLEMDVQKYPKTHAWKKELSKLPYIQKYNVKGAQIQKKIIEASLA